MPKINSSSSKRFTYDLQQNWFHFFFENYFLSNVKYKKRNNRMKFRYSLAVNQSKRIEKKRCFSQKNLSNFVDAVIDVAFRKRPWNLSKDIVGNVSMGVRRLFSRGGQNFPGEGGQKQGPSYPPLWTLMNGSVFKH